MPIKALNVAEKPSVAKEVSRALSNGQARSRRGRARYNPIWDFPYTINGTACNMVFTSVTGHLMAMDFTPRHRGWHSCSPLELYRVPVVKAVPEKSKDLKLHLEELARQCQWLVLWLDCDREGENIGFEVMEVCLGANRSLRVLRARFSALVASELQRTIQRLVAPNAADAAAVDVRQEIDLRVGASFTRLQTLLLQNKFDWLGGGATEGKPLLSYGPCQFPTLGLIVQRAWEIQSHVSEPFWSIHVTYREPAAAAAAAAAAGGGGAQQQQQGARCEFNWARGRLFDGDAAALLYEAVTEEQPITATVMQVQGRMVTKRAPVPLATLEMCKSAGSHLRIAGERIMKLAEELYQAGFISYPRTETDAFDPAMDLRSLVEQQTGDAQWGAHAQAILDGGMWQAPRAGGHDDKAHPPIHPTRYYSASENGWSPEKASLYGYIVRHFLACCSKDAVAQETNVAVDMAGEAFTTRGLMVTERNWLLVMPWVPWGGNANLPHFVEGMTFTPTEVTLHEGATQPPPRLQERDLIAAMERYGIGTDATVAEHIQTQLKRGYAVKDGQTQSFSPTPLGESLIASYRRMGLDNLWKPDLRGRIEAGINRIAAGQVGKEVILGQAVAAFEADFATAMQRTQAMLAEVGRFFNRVDGGGQQQQQQQHPQGGGPGPGGGGPGPGPGGGGPGPGGGGAPPAGGHGGGFGGPPQPSQGFDTSGPDGGHGQPPGSAAPAAAAAAADMQVPLGACPRCGGLLMLQQQPSQGGGGGAGVAAAAAAPRIVCQADLPCSFRLSLPRCVASAGVSQRQCGRCRHGQVMQLELQLRMAIVPPGLFDEPSYSGCILCDDTLQQLLEMAGGGPSSFGRGGGSSNSSRGRARSGAQHAAGGASAAAGGSHQHPQPHQQQQQQQQRQPPPQQQSQQPPSWQQQQQQQQVLSHGGSAASMGARERVMIAPPAPAAGQQQRGPFNDWGTSQAAKVRKQGGSSSATGAKRGSGGGSKGTKRGGASVGSKRGAGKGARGAAAAARGGGGAAPVPCCRDHGEPVRVLTAKSGANAGRVFYKCSWPAEEGGDACLKFAWADEYAGPAGAGGGMQAAAAGGSGTRGGRGGAPRKRAAATGAGGAAQRGAAAARGQQQQAAAAAAAGGGGWQSGPARGGAGGGSHQFVSVTGAVLQTCHRCGQPGHFASSCPNW